MYSIDAYERLVIEHLANRGNSQGSSKSKRIAVQGSASNDDSQIRSMTELHGNVERISDHGNALSMTKAATNLCRCRSGTERNCLSILHYFSGSKSNTTLLSSVELLLSNKGGEVAERFVEQWFDQDCAAMSPA